MSKFEVSFNDKNIIFVNTKTGKAEPIALMESMDDGEAIQALAKENKARESGSRASVSLLAHILDNPRFDGYKGQTPINEALPKELKDAMREAEGEFMKPIFMAHHEAKGAKPGTVAKLWDEYIGALRAGSSYAVAKGKVLAYFAHCGKLPMADNGKLLTVAAIDKLLAMAKEGAEKPENQGIAGKLLKLAGDIENRTETTVMGDPATAVAALKSMLATFEGLLRESLEETPDSAGTPTHPDVSKMAAAALRKVSRDANTAPAAPVAPALM